MLAIVGVGQVVQRPEPGAPGPLDAIGLMVAAARAAAEDAGAPGLLGRVGAVLVPEGTWSPGDAGRVVAEQLGCAGARTTLARVGVLQTTLLGRAVTSGADVVLVVGGEAKASARAGLATVVDATRPPDTELAAAGEIVTTLEIERGLAVPAQSYAVQEDAIRRHRGESPDEHRRRLDDLWDRFAAVAASNPYAWDPAPRSGDRVVATPYTRRHCSQWNVDMAVAVLLCSTAVADAFDVADDRRVHPWAVVDSEAMIPVSRRAELHRSPSMAVVGERLAARTGTHPTSVDHLELYSCFPSAVQLQVSELGIDPDRQLTVTGGMSFGGGPLNSAALHGVASMVDVLRRSPGSTGLVTAVSGMLTKFGASLWSTAPPRRDFVHEDVGEEVVAATATVDVDPDHVGDVVVEGATVAGDVAVVLGRTATGCRAVLTGEAAVLRAQR